MNVTLGPGFGAALLAGSLMSWQCYVFSMNNGMKMRKKYFTPEVMDRFKEQHQASFKCDPDPLGYPDLGDGRFSKSLEYQDWVRWRYHQYLHSDMVEGLTVTLPQTIIAGAFYPRFTMVLAANYITSRYVFTRWVSSSKGANDTDYLRVWVNGTANIISMTSLTGSIWWFLKLLRKVKIFKRG
mmetsp:Transcript_40665/g.46748  ORF Transcript_40665/g.46748 Transcript_40665/m.46748 type:complete len:183 (-) Transcript_40665:57-605(-)